MRYFDNRFVPVNWKMDSIIAFWCDHNEIRVVFDTREQQ